MYDIYIVLLLPEGKNNISDELLEPFVTVYKNHHVDTNNDVISQNATQHVYHVSPEVQHRATNRLIDNS